FTIVLPNHPHVSRADGGQLIIFPKVVVTDRTQLTREQAIELMKLTMVAGAGMHTVLNRRGIDIWRTNYQDNGNWRPELHVDLYGRAKSSKMQPYGHFLTIPPTPEAFKQQPELEPLNAEDVAELRAKIERLPATEKYKNYGEKLVQDGTSVRMKSAICTRRLSTLSARKRAMGKPRVRHAAAGFALGNTAAELARPSRLVEISL
ncbi:MAG: hypothetical protein ABIH03_00320, partial [Pseudomonadota bacterium]